MNPHLCLKDGMSHAILSRKVSQEKSQAMKDAEKNIKKLEDENQKIIAEVEKEKAVSSKFESQLRKMQSTIAELEVQSK